MTTPAEPTAGQPNHGPHASVSLLRRRGFAAAVVLNFLLMAGLFGSLILIPLYYQVDQHDSTLQTGLLLAAKASGLPSRCCSPGRWPTGSAPAPSPRPGSSLPWPAPSPTPRSAPALPACTWPAPSA